MATQTGENPMSISNALLPPLQAGDHLTRAEFECRYEAMTDVKQAELIEGVVYMPSPVSTTGHAQPHFRLITWMGQYQAVTPGVEGGDNATVRLDADNEPQPDAFLRILPEHGGQSRTVDGYVEGAPELVAEIAASTASHDLHEKLNVYRRNGVCEYLVWRVWDKEIDWFVLREGRYERLPTAPEGHLHSERFPGLRLDAAALIEGRMQQVADVLQQGLKQPEHGEFVRRLQQAAPQ